MLAKEASDRVVRDPGLLGELGELGDRHTIALVGLDQDAAGEHVGGRLVAVGVAGAASSASDRDPVRDQLSGDGGGADIQPAATSSRLSPRSTYRSTSAFLSTGTYLPYAAIGDAASARLPIHDPGRGRGVRLRCGER